MKKQVVYEHTDKLGQTIVAGQHVVFSWAHLSGVNVGVVEKVTAKRVRIKYAGRYKVNDKWISYIGKYQAVPTECVLLNDHTQQYLLLKVLNG